MINDQGSFFILMEKNISYSPLCSFIEYIKIKIFLVYKLTSTLHFFFTCHVLLHMPILFWGFCGTKSNNKLLHKKVTCWLYSLFVMYRCIYSLYSPKRLTSFSKPLFNKMNKCPQNQMLSFFLRGSS